ncbi:MAG: hypothetical protein WBB02_12690 [Saprospiraceae bacterium]
MTNSTLQDVFRFTSLRAPKTPKDEKWYCRYAKDNFFSYIEEIQWLDRNLLDKDISKIGAKIFYDVFCDKTKDHRKIIDEVVELDGFGRKVLVECTEPKTIPISTQKIINGLPSETEYTYSEYIENLASLSGKGEIYSWFLSHTIQGFTPKLDLAERIIQTHLINFNKQKLICQLQNALQISNLSDFVLDVKIENGRVSPQTGNTEKFKNIKGNLFDLLYFLYISKRKFPVNLDHIIRQIQTLHVIEFLAYDDFAHDYEVERRREGCNWIVNWLYRLFNPASDSLQKSMVNKRVPIDASLIGINDACDISEFTAIGIFVTEPYINSREDLLAFFSVQPIVHPIFSRLNYFHIPFNNIRPVGISDLKIVKQILVRYEAGEIAHVENVLKGENKERIHRRLDTVESFISDETTRENETNRETQTTDRNEMQRETERTINEAMNFNMDASVHYSGIVDATLRAGYSSDRSTEESNRNATNFAKEVIQKSAERITQRTQSLRTARRTSETEETNRHGLNNEGKDKHIIGIYRYINKRYKAQIFNYGERMMFEFLIPEPSEFYKKTIENKNNNISVEEFQPIQLFKTLEQRGINDKLLITKEIVEEYSDKSQLDTAFESYPYLTKVEKKETRLLYAGKATKIINPLNGQVIVDIPKIIKDNTIEGIFSADIESTMERSEEIKWGEQGETVNPDTLTLIANSKITISAKFIAMAHDGHHFDKSVQEWKRPDQHAWIYLECAELKLKIEVAVTEEKNVMVTNFNEIDVSGFPSPNARNSIVLNNKSATNLIFKSKSDWCRFYFIEITILQEEDPATIDKWKEKVYNDINVKIDERNKEIKKANDDGKKEFDKAQKKLYEDSLFKIIGKNQEINRVIVNEELHKHAITLFAKEFDKDSDGDLLTDNPIDHEVESIKKNIGTAKKKDANGTELNECESNPINVIECKIFPVINIEKARKKGEVVQFLEQAFEWDKISYLLYPYFYGDKSRWMETYDHYDNEEKDTAFVSFLRAGYARVLVPVRDSHRDAVLQFLYNRQPWNGGSAPVIGDDLYLPIYEELRNQTDEYYKAVPEGEPWEYVLPTSLIYLQEDANLPVFSSNFPVSTST